MKTHLLCFAILLTPVAARADCTVCTETRLHSTTTAQVKKTTPKSTAPASPAKPSGAQPNKKNDARPQPNYLLM